MLIRTLSYTAFVYDVQYNVVGCCNLWAHDSECDGQERVLNCLTIEIALMSTPWSFIATLSCKQLLMVGPPGQVYYLGWIPRP